MSFTSLVQTIVFWVLQALVLNQNVFFIILWAYLVLPRGFRSMYRAKSLKWKVTWILPYIPRKPVFLPKNDNSKISAVNFCVNWEPKILKNFLWVQSHLNLRSRKWFYVNPITEREILIFRYPPQISGFFGGGRSNCVRLFEVCPGMKGFALFLLIKFVSKSKSFVFVFTPKITLLW